MLANVAEPGSAEASVADGMNQNIGVGMTVQSFAVRNLYAAEN
jgi:hypothetical protein